MAKVMSKPKKNVTIVTAPMPIAGTVIGLPQADAAERDQPHNCASEAGDDLLATIVHACPCDDETAAQDADENGRCAHVSRRSDARCCRTSLGLGCSIILAKRAIDLTRTR